MEEKIIGKCPECGEDFLEKEKLFACSTAKSFKDEETGDWVNEGCQFKIFKSSLQRFGKEELTTEEVIELLENGKAVVELVGKGSGKPYKKDILIDKQYGIKVDFNSHNEKK